MPSLPNGRSLSGMPPSTLNRVLYQRRCRSQILQRPPELTAVTKLIDPLYELAVNFQDGQRWFPCAPLCPLCEGPMYALVHPHTVLMLGIRCSLCRMKRTRLELRNEPLGGIINKRLREDPPPKQAHLFDTRPYARRNETPDMYPPGQRRH